MTLFFNFLIFFAFIAFCAKRSLIYLHALQQDDYDNQRMLQWVGHHVVLDRRLSIGLLVLGGFQFLLPQILTKIILIALLSATAYFDIDPRDRSKKKLVLTARAQRILFPGIAIGALIGSVFIFAHPWWVIIPVQLVPIYLILSNLLNQPFEKKIQEKFYNEAVEKLHEVQPMIIGITGSFGKTSVKHILGHVLKATAPTLITPGSVNTVMGITRIIREQMDPNTKYFVVEMGAYGPGSIMRLCRFTPPDMGLIVAIGQAHYERFKTLETVAGAKFELAQDVLSRNGHVVVNAQCLAFDAAQAVYAPHKEQFAVCGDQKEHDVQVQNIEQTIDGLVVDVIWQNQNYRLKAPLYGLHHGSNIALAFTAALRIGLEPKDIITALETCPQIQHRLEVKRQSDGSYLIDDAFNSNPKGFQAALELMTTLKSQDGRSILITPGMVELGEAHDEEHARLGGIAAKHCDIVLAVNPERIESFIQSYQQHSTEGTLERFATFSDAEQWLIANRKPKDVILIENDLPDIYERLPKI